MIPDISIENILESMRGKRVLVVGDLILDHYLSGRVERISPEAPVPIVSLENRLESWVPGGAANVARNILSLGGIPLMSGVTGDDDQGIRLKSILESEGVDVGSVVVDPDRPTTTKTRIMSDGHQIIRLDSEVTNPVSGHIPDAIVSSVSDSITSLDAVILQDYNKGVLTPEVIRGIISICREHSVPITVDPKFDNFFQFSNCSLFKPNRKETSLALGRSLACLDDAAIAGAELLERLSCDAVLVTLGGEGSVLCRKGKPPFHRPTAARHVYDVSGAGDTVIAAVTLAMAGGNTLEDSVRTSGFAAAATCAEPGVYAVRPEDILREVDRYTISRDSDAD